MQVLRLKNQVEPVGYLRQDLSHGRCTWRWRKICGGSCLNELPMKLKVETL